MHEYHYSLPCKVFLCTVPFLLHMIWLPLWNAWDENMLTFRSNFVHLYSSVYFYFHIYRHICIRKSSKSTFISILYYLYSQPHLSNLYISHYQLYIIHIFCAYHGMNRHQLQTRNICYSCQLISSTLKYPLTEFMTTPCRFWWWAAVDHS